MQLRLDPDSQNLQEDCLYSGLHHRPDPGCPVNQIHLLNHPLNLCRNLYLYFHQVLRLQFFLYIPRHPQLQELLQLLHLAHNTQGGLPVHQYCGFSCHRILL